MGIVKCYVIWNGFISAQSESKDTEINKYN